ncbi:uncharacterized protein LOC127285559 isoform X2 [Leptopilina boulardi]|uniref:uncharacterized protein LOC127285559 isoform X2 n=1 Tax=Leptopilina boulardi TaxID=63433 RepID=UPI0021F556E9|nr:uncharacterized protein LOC127285559 isoform X2 [Leptopilina boulardi]
MESGRSSADTWQYDDFLAGRIPPQCPTKLGQFLDKILLISVDLGHSLGVWQALRDLCQNMEQANRKKGRPSRKELEQRNRTTQFDEVTKEILSVNAELADVISLITCPDRLSNCWCGKCRLGEREIPDEVADIAAIPGPSTATDMQEFF